MSYVSEEAYSIAIALGQALAFFYLTQDPFLSLAVFVLYAISTYGLLKFAKMVLNLIQT